ncbi:hypothetical protein SCHPADRAFT_890079 [Schizopora paradoxa]|uniref:Uncharacterized protein n=1 Tax=Schizopora paradoxa TaxID=27342 RepID=A0A0H2RMW8_9AGAM|nr:hypothetical protein SCHPADRAFT_890079 [Schizopora paradoxa]
MVHGVVRKEPSDSSESRSDAIAANIRAVSYKYDYRSTSTYDPPSLFFLSFLPVEVLVVVVIAVVVVEDPCPSLGAIIVLLRAREPDSSPLLVNFKLLEIVTCRNIEKRVEFRHVLRYDVKGWTQWYCDHGSTTITRQSALQDIPAIASDRDSEESEGSFRTTPCTYSPPLHSRHPALPLAVQPAAAPPLSPARSRPKKHRKRMYMGVLRVLPYCSTICATVQWKLQALGNVPTWVVWLISQLFRGRLGPSEYTDATIRTEHIRGTLRGVLAVRWQLLSIEPYANSDRQ